MIALGHADAQATLSQPVHVLVTAILTALVGVMNRLGVHRQLLQRMVQRSHTTNRFQAVARVRPHYLARILIRNQRQIQVALLGPQVTQITDPYLIGSLHRRLLYQIPKYRQVVIGLRRARILRRQRRQQQIPFPQLLEQAVPADAHSGLLQFELEQVMEFARAQTRLQLALAFNQTRHQLPVHSPPLPLPPPCVLVLPAHPQLAAPPTDAPPGPIPGLLYRCVSSCPAAFFLNSATSSIPARSHARRVYWRSSARSMFVSATAASTRLTRSCSRFNSLISSGRSTRTLAPRVPLPYLRTQACTVQVPRIPYLRRACSKGKSRSSTSRTTIILNASLYLRPAFCPALVAMR